MIPDDFAEYCKQFRHYAASMADVKADLSKIPDDYGYKENEIGFGIDGTFRNLLIEWNPHTSEYCKFL